jgi:hypothetical protein
LSSVATLLRARWVRALWFALLGAALALRTWRKWPDVIVDFGRELYTPWRLAEGGAFARDVVGLFGPLSQEFNGWLFRVFGPSLSTLIWANLALLALLVWLIDGYFTRAAGALAGWTAGTVFLTAFAFNQYVPTGNYNFVTPYAHEATHGVLLAVAMLVLLELSFRAGSIVASAGAGLCLGAVNLTKPEVALAAAAGALTGFALFARSGQAMRRHLLCFALSAGVAPMAAVALFSRTSTMATAIDITLGAWAPLWKGHAATGFFYQHGLGFDAPGDAARAALVVLAEIVAVLAVALIADRVVPLGRARAIAGTSGGVGIFVLLARWPFLNGWMDIGRPLPLVTGVLALGWIRLAWKARQSTGERQSFIGLAMWAVFSLGLLAKMVLHARLYQYGFYLAMPATLLVAVVLVQLAPDLLGRLHDGGTVFRSLALGVLGAFVSVHLSFSDRLYAQKTFPVGAGGDQMITLGPEHTSRNAAFEKALRTVATLSPEGGSVAVLPEGVMLNYLLRRPAPTPFIAFLPPELATFGEAHILDALRASPPDVVVLIHADPREDYGVPFFGQSESYGARSMSWIRSGYDVVRTIGAEPLVQNRFGIQILSRRH